MLYYKLRVSDNHCTSIGWLAEFCANKFSRLAMMCHDSLHINFTSSESLSITLTFSIEMVCLEQYIWLESAEFLSSKLEPDLICSKRRVLTGDLFFRYSVYHSHYKLSHKPHLSDWDYHPWLLTFCINHWDCLLIYIERHKSIHSAYVSPYV